MTVRCFYHSADLDGKCGGAVVLAAYPDAVMYPIDYGDPFPWGDIEPDDLVIMVDFSLQPWSDMVRLWMSLFEIGRFVWIDHHQSALTHYAAWLNDPNGEIEGIRREGIGACQLAWEHFFPDQRVPRAVELLALYDVWKHEDPDVLPFQYGMRLYDADPRAPVWAGLLGPSQYVQDMAISPILTRGRPAYEHVIKDNAVKAQTLWFPTALPATPTTPVLTLMAANAGPANSQLFDSVWVEHGADLDAMCLFYWRPAHRKWHVSLYAPPDKVAAGVNCGMIAGVYGGGGHPQAAGFECDELPFVLGDRPSKEGT